VRYTAGARQPGTRRGAVLVSKRPRKMGIAAEQKCNPGYGLYKASQDHGGWRMEQKDWRPYRGIMQLFGPGAAPGGLWKTIQIKNLNPISGSAWPTSSKCFGHIGITSTWRNKLPGSKAEGGQTCTCEQTVD
jgi:hypothetical protein